MHESDVLRGFIPPNTERNYIKVNDHQLKSNSRVEEHFMLTKLPYQLAEIGTHRASIKQRPSFTTVFSPSKETIETAENILVENGFVEESEQTSESNV